MRTAILAVLSALIVLTQSAYAAAEKRVALVLGLSAYEHVPELSNPRNDAADVADKLRGLGFEVVEGYDLDHGGLTGKIREFSRAMVGADTALFYYSGHGIQASGANYLVPVDTRLASATDIDFELVPLDLVTQQMQIAQAEKTLKVGLVFLDACRNNPLTRNFKSASRSVGAGLAKVQEAPHGMLISFSTQPGNVALDGIGRNSPFTKAVLNHIDKPGLSVGDMLINVRTDVMRETDEKQVPWENSSLTGQFFFNPAQAPTKVASLSDTVPALPAQRDSVQVLTVDDSALDMKFWESISASTNPAMFNAYLARFPNGAFAPLAKAKLDELAQKRAIAVEAVEPKAPSLVQQPNETLQQAEAAPSAPQQTTKVASLDPQEPVAADGPAPGSFDAAVLLQTELQRVGCYSGRIDGDWGRMSRRAMDRFNGATKSAFSLDTPDQAAIDAVRDVKSQVCVQAIVAERPAKVERAPEPKPAAKKVRTVAKPQVVQEPQPVKRKRPACPRGHVFAEGQCIFVQQQPQVMVAPPPTVRFGTGFHGGNRVSFGNGSVRIGIGF